MRGACRFPPHPQQGGSNPPLKCSLVSSCFERFGEQRKREDGKVGLSCFVLDLKQEVKSSAGYQLTVYQEFC